MAETLSHCQDAAMGRKWLLTFVCLLALGGPAAGARAEIQEPNTSGTVFLGSFRSEGEIFSLVLEIPNSHAAILSVDGAKVREVPYSLWTRYAVRPSQPLASGTVEADFGSIGHVSLSFQPTRKPKIGRRPKKCAGARPRRETGTYTGTISLRGENGYFQVEGVAAKGIRYRTFRLVCRHGYAGHPGVEQPLGNYVTPFTRPPESAQTQLETFAELDGRSVGFTAWEFFRDFPATQAGALESLPGMEIGRVRYEAYPLAFQAEWPMGGAMTFKTPLQESAAYNPDPSAPATWSDELRSSFPGLPVQPVAGPQFRTSLCMRRAPGEALQCVGDPPPVQPQRPLDPPQP
jgi:hypothetical protein